MLIKNRILPITLLLLCLTIITVSCKKKKEEEVTPDTNALTGEVLTDFSYKVALATYTDLNAKATLLNSKVIDFNASSSQSDLDAAKQLWKDSRAAWEQSEAFLFGPVATQDIDPGIDDWPVNKADFDSLLVSNVHFTAGYLDSAQTTLKGFHPLEYLLFGANGNKLASDVTPKEKEYMLGLADYLKRMTDKIIKSWNPSEPANYLTQVVNAGQAGSVYATKRAAFEEMINAMIGICDEVANRKIQEPLVAQDPTLEESQFSQNSIADFTNNMRSVQNVYFGNYIENGKGLNEWVNASNISLDNKVQQKMSAAINSFNLITLPFGQAILSQQTQLHSVQQSINELKDVLENELLPFVQQTITD